jgi:hypothetical protein
VTRRLPLWSRGALLVAALGVAGTACATTYDATEASTVPVDTTTTVPSGTPVELLQELLDDAARLGNLIDDHDAESASVLRQLQAVWAVARPEIQRTSAPLVREFDTNITVIAKAIDANRPADADKAYRNLASLVDSYAAGPGADVTTTSST